MAERGTLNPEVEGSTPSTPSIHPLAGRIIAVYNDDVTGAVYACVILGRETFTRSDDILAIYWLDDNSTDTILTDAIGTEKHGVRYELVP